MAPPTITYCNALSLYEFSVNRLGLPIRRCVGGASWLSFLKNGPSRRRHLQKSREALPLGYPGHFRFIRQGG